MCWVMRECGYVWAVNLGTGCWRVLEAGGWMIASGVWILVIMERRGGGDGRWTMDDKVNDTGLSDDVWRNRDQRIKRWMVFHNCLFLGIVSHSHLRDHFPQQSRNLTLTTTRLGNVGVIAAGLVIWFFEGRWTLYFDPAVSLLITCIIFSSALPLGESINRSSNQHLIWMETTS